MAVKEAPSSRGGKPNPARRSRRRLAAGALGGLALVAMTPVAVMTLSSSDESVSGVQAARSFLAMLRDRSPGQRTDAQLIKSKARVVIDLPRQRALGKVRDPKVPDEFARALAPPLPEVFEIAPTAPLFDDTVTLASLSMPGISTIVPLTSGGGGGGSGGGGGDGGGEEEPPPPPPNVPLAPEPGTWAMMLLGFGITGWMFRLRRRQDTQASHA